MTFTMYEDDGISTDYLNGVCARTEFDMYYDREAHSLRVEISTPKGERSFVPEDRRYRLHLMGVERAGELAVDKSRHEAVMDCGIVGRESYTINLSDVVLAVNDHHAKVLSLLQSAWISTRT